MLRKNSWTMGAVLAAMSVVFVSLLSMGAAQANVIAVADASFETPANTAGNATIVWAGELQGTGSGTFPGWGLTVTYGGNSAVGNFNPTGTGMEGTGYVGSQVAFLQGATGNAFYQATGTKLQPNTLYTLTVGVAGQSAADAILTIASEPGPDLTWTELAARTITAPGTPFQDYSVSYTTGATVADEYVAVGLSYVGPAPDSTKQVYYDNVRLTAQAVPEPATISLLTAGVLGLLAYAWRKRR